MKDTLPLIILGISLVIAGTLFLCAACYQAGETYQRAKSDAEWAKILETEHRLSQGWKHLYELESQNLTIIERQKKINEALKEMGVIL